MTLIEQAEKTFDQEQALKAADEAHRPGRRVHPRRLPRADAAGPQARLDVEDHGDAARDGAVPRPARELRRARDRPDPGDHPVDDAGRAGQPQDDRRLPPRPHRQGLRPPGLRRQQPRRPLLRGPQDDDVASPRAAGCPASRGCPAWPSAASAAGPSRPPRTSRARAAASAATRPRPPPQAKAAEEKAAAAGQPVRQPRRRGDRLREGRGGARPAEGLLQVPEVAPDGRYGCDRDGLSAEGSPRSVPRGSARCSDQLLGAEVWGTGLR